ncbi:MAG: hypothetical protein ONB15_02465 [candidate division KSB1 bacterium]|nr:hypothetical protein [candidate division KSB1 bacterium]
MNDAKVFFRRNLPHYQPAGATFFITFRVAGSLPAEVVQRLKDELRRQLKAAGKDRVLAYRSRIKHFGKFDEYLDRVSYGEPWLARDEIARVVAESLRYWDGLRYYLLCHCIMPNHVHLVIEPFASAVAQVGNLRYLLSPILHSIKRHTAVQANRILRRRGPFWQHESYDHVVRDEEELARIVWYVAHNPVKAELTARWNDWRWTYVRPELAAGILD